MLKKSLLLGIAALLAQGVFADTLTPEEALQRASAQNSGRRLISAKAQPRLAYTARTEQGVPAVYVFSQEGGGAVLLSASDCAIPVLGYTDSGDFDPNNIPPQMQYWMEEYAAQIAYAEANDIKPKSKDVAITYPSSWTFIAPLVQTKWDQGMPYSSLLPNKNYATGCVATAMAQIMKYHEFPTRGKGYISYEDYYKQSYSMAFDTQDFNWADMLDEYTAGNYTNQQADAVGYLMKACGYSTKMNYAGSSGTMVELAGIALCQYFYYSNEIQSLQRYQFTNSEWASIIYEQLKSVGPVLYSGHSLGGMAHAFVCDGYDGNGYFHINWGWSGLCNGYYSLDALVPDAQGTGGSNYGGFNFSQGMITNIQPGDGSSSFSPTAEFILLGNMSGSMSGRILTLSMTEANPGNLVNSSMVTINPTFAVKFENTETGAVTYTDIQGTYFNGQQYNLTPFGPGSFIDPPLSVKVVVDPKLPDGRYKAQLVWKNKTNDNTWHNFIINNGCHDYVYLIQSTQGSATEYSIENLPMEYFKIESAEVITPLYMRNPCQIQFKVTNPFDNELTQSIVPVLLYGDDKKLSFEGDSQLVTVKPNETKTVTCTYTFTAVSGGTSPTTNTPREYTLGAFDGNMLLDHYYTTEKGNFRDSYYGDLGTATMKRPESNSSIQMRSITIPNGSGGMVDGIGFLYSIDDFSHIDVDVTIQGRTGFVATPLSAVVTTYDPQTYQNGPVVYEKNFENLIFVEAGNSSMESVQLNMNEFDPSAIYTVTIYYVQSNARQTLGSVRFAASSGVDDVIGEGALNLSFDGSFISVTSENGLASVVVYDLSGKTVAAPGCNGASAATVDISSLAKGIYLVKASDNNGNEKVLKIHN